MRLGDLDDLKVHISELMLVYKGTELDNAILNAIDNAPTVDHPNCDICEDKAKQYSLGFQDGYLTGKERPQGEWIEIPVKRDLLYNTGIKYTCSICGKGNCYGKPPFCMYCGARNER